MINTWSCLILSPTLGPSKTVLSTQTVRDIPGSHFEVFPTTYYRVLLAGDDGDWTCDLLHIKAEVLPPSHGSSPKQFNKDLNKTWVVCSVQITVFRRESSTALWGKGDWSASPEGKQKGLCWNYPAADKWGITGPNWTGIWISIISILHPEILLVYPRHKLLRYSNATRLSFKSKDK